MSYQVTLNSRNVLVPVALEGRDGRRLNALPSRLDTATAMVIAVSSEGSFSQEFIPLRIVSDSTQAYAGTEWELRAQRAGRDWFVFYLGVPDRCFASPGKDSSAEPKSLSIQVVGSSPLTGRGDYTGGVDVALQAQVALPLIPGFLSLGERFFPTLLPHNFVEAYALDVFELAGRRDLVLMASLQADPADRTPVSFGKHWDPKNWVGAVVENLSPVPGTYHTVRGGCFFSRSRRVTHWFGGEIGLEDRSFRQAAAERIRSTGVSGNGAWVFWLEPQGKGFPASQSLQGIESRHPQARFSIRHPMLHRLLSRRAPAALAASPSIARLPAESAVGALSKVARILADHQDELHRARTEPAHALWSEQAVVSPAVAVAGAIAAAEPGGATESSVLRAKAGMSSLENSIRELYRTQGEALRTLESVFDETSGYAAWDTVSNPMRELLAAYLGEGAEARSQV